MNLIKKYNVAIPRYTSYPTVPYWDEKGISINEWKESVKFSFSQTNHNEGISIYIHLPFCESLCTYCGCNTRITVNHSVESPYLLAVLKEWSMYLELFEETPRIKQIHLGGGTPTFFNSNHLKELIEGITSSAIICKDAEFSFEAHPANTTEKHLKTLYSLGFKRLSLGIQDFNQKVQDIINRKQSFQQVENIVKQARKIGYNSINFDLIYGLPLQTRASVIQTINMVNELMPDRIAFYSYAHVPWIKPGQRKFTELDLPVDEEKRALYEIGREMFKKNGYVEIGMDHFALKTDSLYAAQVRGKLHRNFMGYTENNTKLQIGLGVSSISDTWYSFAQNVKKVEEYYELIEKNQFPIFKGHSLNQEDLIIRQHILNIMCRYKTSWHNEAEECEAVYDAIEKLKELEKDSLIELKPFELKVKKRGRAFLRNICAAFDAKLWANSPKTQIFSTAV